MSVYCRHMSGHLMNQTSITYSINIQSLTFDNDRKTTKHNSKLYTPSSTHTVTQPLNFKENYYSFMCFMNNTTVAPGKYYRIGTYRTWTTRSNDKPLRWTVHRTDVAIRDGSHRTETTGTTTARFQNLPRRCTTAATAYRHYPPTGRASFFYLRCAQEKRRRPPGKRFSVP